MVDDDSPDGTWKLAQDLDDPRVKVIRRVGTRGLASAFNRGILESRGGIVGWMDADMCMPPSVLPDMYRMLVDEGFDIVIGSRYAPGGVDDRRPIRTLASRLINGFALESGIIRQLGHRAPFPGILVDLRSADSARASLRS